MTKEQVLLKLTSICAKSEHCIDDMRKKMLRWQIEDSIQEEVVKFLVAEKYIDESRYARYFINDKMKYNKWGRRKVEQALYLKRIPREIYIPLLDEIDKESFLEILLPLLKTKNKSVKANSPYERKMKLIRFALQRGFSYEQAESVLSQIDLDV